MKTQRIDIEGRGQIRNRHRLIVEADCEPEGCCVMRHRVPMGTSRVEIYEDELSDVMERVRTPAQVEAAKMAEGVCDEHVKDWEKEHQTAKRSKTPAEWKRFVSINCNLAPQQFYSMFGMKTGLPPLRSLKVVSRDDTSTVSADAYLKMTPAKRSMYLIDAPHTPENAQDRAQDQFEKLTEAIKAAVVR